MIVFMYPGQGSQVPGMGTPWKDHPSWELVGEASEVAGRDLADLLLEADADTLTLTRNSQLTTFVLSMVALDAVTRVGVEAAGHAGHSLGEYSALTGAGVVDFADSVTLVSERGDAMQAAADERSGTMAAILGLDDDQVDIACARVTGDVWVANYNAPGQVVIAGAADAVAEAGEVAKELGAKRSMPLPVGGAFHTPFMSPARDRLSKAIDQTEFRDADTFVVSNVDAAVHQSSGDWQGLLNAQLCSPVRWRQSLHTLGNEGATTFIEIGPGAVLTGMVKRTIKDSTRITINTPADVDAAVGETVAENVPGPGAGTLETPGNYDEYTFAVAPGTAVLFDELVPSCGTSPRWDLFDADGLPVFENQRLADCGGAAEETVTLEKGGTYTIRVRASLDLPETGPYSFRLVEQ